jgi:hypothetical protein
MNLRGIVCDVDWTQLAQYMVGFCEHGNELSGYVEGKEFLD